MPCSGDERSAELAREEKGKGEKEEAMTCRCAHIPEFSYEAALRGDPLAQKLVSMGAIGGNTSLPECDLPVHLVTNATIEALKKRIDPDMRSTDADVDKCPSVDPAERSRWKLFYQGWRAWADAPTGILDTWDPFLGPLAGQFGAGARWDAGCAMSRELSAFKDKLRETCKISGPTEVERPAGLDLNNVAGAVKWGAVAVVAIAGVYALSKVWP